MIGCAAFFPTRKRITEHEMADASRGLRRCESPCGLEALNGSALPSIEPRHRLAISDDDASARHATETAERLVAEHLEAGVLRRVAIAHPIVIA
jgi:hypothetical protein